MAHRGILTALMFALWVSGCGQSTDVGMPRIPTPEDVSPQAACSALASITVGGAYLGSTALIAAGLANEYCKITGTLHGTLNFEAHLPTMWNDKLLYLGGGGWDGSITITPYSPASAAANYVFVASDGGRQGSSFDASAFQNAPQAQADFGYSGIHDVLGVVEQIVAQRYGHAPVRKYFEGCSNGGREALIQATRYPEDYDGIVARAPAHDFTRLLQAFIANGKALATTPVSDAKTALLSTAVLDACDALDGLADGIVSNPAACVFDPSTLVCAGADDGACLTTGELGAVRAIGSPLKATDGTTLYPGWGFGGESDPLGWPSWVTGSGIGGIGLQLIFGSGFVKYWVTNDAATNALFWNPDAFRAELAGAAALLDAGTDLRAFADHGGKLILAQGTTDWAVSYKSTIAYYEAASAMVGDSRRPAIELFLEPGVQHCFGGAGADTVELVEAVAAWAEGDERPSTQGIIATKLSSNGTATLTRPLCGYPTYPKYDGTGNATEATSFSCSE